MSPTKKVHPSFKIDRTITPSLSNISPSQIAFADSIKPPRDALFIAGIASINKVPPSDPFNAIDYFVCTPKWAVTIPFAETKFNYKKQNITTYFNVEEYRHFMGEINYAANPTIGFIESSVWLLLLPLRLMFAILLKLTCVEKLLVYKYGIEICSKLVMPLKVIRSERYILQIITKFNVSNKLNLSLSYERAYEGNPQKNVHPHPARIHFFLLKPVNKGKSVRVVSDAHSVVIGVTTTEDTEDLEANVGVGDRSYVGNDVIDGTVTDAENADLEPSIGVVGNGKSYGVGEAENGTRITAGLSSDFGRVNQYNNYCNPNNFNLVVSKEEIIEAQPGEKKVNVPTERKEDIV